MAKLRAFTAAGRAADAWKRISDKPSAIILSRKGVTQAAQTVRLEYGVAFREESGGAGEMAIGSVYVFGVRDHATVADTDIKRNDQFMVDDTIYVVVQVVGFPGEVQARCEAVQ